MDSSDIRGGGFQGHLYAAPTQTEVEASNEAIMGMIYVW